MSRTDDVASMADPAPTRFWNVPNTLTLGRLVLGTVVFALIANRHYLAALVTFGLASLTDALDGYFARLLNQATASGRQLDPLIDKVIVSGAYIYLLATPGTGVQPWMVTIIVLRELLIQGLRSHLEGHGEPFGAKMAGKLKMLFQCLSISAILLLLALAPAPRQAPAWLILRDVLTWIAVGLTLYSGLGYVVMAWPKLRGEAPTG
jgi:CDP-diacylglycerol---glycerol-3-phosphate 3-phosphatidyltransferase